jgi:membrane-bound lytic murein transglycosylase D
MKKLLLLTMLGGAYSQYVTAQTLIAKETTSHLVDTVLKISALKKDLPRQRLIADTKKITDNPAFNFKNLFESDGSDIINGPRLNPRAISFVEDYIDKYGDDLAKMKVWGKPYFNMMDGVFVENHLPRELKYIAVIESRLNPSSISFAGAVGPWQFMPSTAIRMGLKVSRYVDERTNYIKSTQAAAKYLTALYKQFGDWLLVIAAYNGGPGNVLKAIRKSGSRNFWDIQYYLPTESRNHVKKFIGTHYIFEGQGGLTTLTRAESNDHYGVMGGYASNRKINGEESANAVEQTITGKYHSIIIAKNIAMDIADFNRYNPEFDKVMASSKNAYQLKLPTDKMEVFNIRKYQILNESIQLLLNYAAPTPDMPAKKL